MDDMTWKQAVARVGLVTVAAKEGLRTRASIKAISDSSAAEAFRELVPDMLPSEEARRLYSAATYASAIALARYAELMPHDRDWLMEAVGELALQRACADMSNLAASASKG